MKIHRKKFQALTHLTICFAFFGHLFSACAVNGFGIFKEEKQTKSQFVCGDGFCVEPENYDICPEDCSEEVNELPGSASSPGEVHWVTNPTSGEELFVKVLTPAEWIGDALPALVLIPGGSGDSGDFTSNPQKIHRFLEDGYALILFDPDGRGKSGGIEDDNGFTHQDGLAAVVQYAAKLPQVDAGRIGMVSYSYGVTMAAGALARYPDLPVLFLIDWEGPANRDDTGGCDGDKLGHLQAYDCCDHTFWRQREAARFALDLRVPYLRLQSEIDHVQPDNSHAFLMVNSATAKQYGGKGRSVWTRLNDLPPNQVYNLLDLPPLVPEEEANAGDQMMLNAVREMFALGGRDYRDFSSSFICLTPPSVTASASWRPYSAEARRG